MAPFIMCGPFEELAPDGSPLPSQVVRLFVIPEDVQPGDEVSVELEVRDGPNEPLSFVPDRQVVGLHGGPQVLVVRRENGGLEGRTLLFHVGGLPYRLHVGSYSPYEVEKEHGDEWFVEDPLDTVNFAARISPEPDHPEQWPEHAMMMNFHTSELRQVELPEGVRRIEASIDGQEGESVMFAMRYPDGHRWCVKTPCGCTRARREAGECRADARVTPPSGPGDPPE